MSVFETKLRIFFLMLFLINHFNTNLVFAKSKSTTCIESTTSITSNLSEETSTLVFDMNLTETSITPGPSNFSQVGSRTYTTSSLKMNKQHETKSTKENINRTFDLSISSINESSTKIISKREKFGKNVKKSRRRLSSPRVSLINEIFRTTNVVRQKKLKTVSEFDKRNISSLTYPPRWISLVTENEIGDFKCPSRLSSLKPNNKVAKLHNLLNFDEIINEKNSRPPALTFKSSFFSSKPELKSASSVNDTSISRLKKADLRVTHSSTAVVTGIWFANDSLTLIFNRNIALNSVTTPATNINASEKHLWTNAKLEGSTISQVNISVFNRTNSEKHAVLQNLTRVNLTFDDTKAATFSININNISKIIANNTSEIPAFGNSDNTILGIEMLKPKAINVISSNPMIRSLNNNALVSVSKKFENATDITTFSKAIPTQNKFKTADYEWVSSTKQIEVVTKNWSILTSTFWRDLQNISCPPLHVSKILSSFDAFLDEELLDETQSTAVYQPNLVPTKKRERITYLPDYTCPGHSPSWVPRKSWNSTKLTKCPIRLRQIGLTTNPLSMFHQNSTETSDLTIFSYLYPENAYSTSIMTISGTLRPPNTAINWTYGSVLPAVSQVPDDFFNLSANELLATMYINYNVSLSYNLTELVTTTATTLLWSPIIHVISLYLPSNPTTVNIRCTSTSYSRPTWTTRIFLWTERLPVSLSTTSSSGNGDVNLGHWMKESAPRFTTISYYLNRQHWPITPRWLMNALTSPFTTRPYYLDSSYTSVLTTSTPEINYSFYMTSQCLVYSRGTYIWKLITYQWWPIATSPRWTSTTKIMPVTYLSSTNSWSTKNTDIKGENVPNENDSPMAPIKRVINEDSNIKQAGKTATIFEMNKMPNFVVWNDEATSDVAVGEVEYVLKPTHNYYKLESIYTTPTRHLLSLRNPNLKDKITEKSINYNSFKVLNHFGKTTVRSQLNNNLKSVKKLTISNLNLNEKQFRNSKNPVRFSQKTNLYVREQNLKEYGGHLLPLNKMKATALKIKNNFKECNLLYNKEWFPSQLYSSATMANSFKRHFEYEDNKKMQTSIRSKHQVQDSPTCYLKVMKACSAEDCLSTKPINMFWTPSEPNLGAWNQQLQFTYLLPYLMKSTITTYFWMAPSTTATKYYKQGKTFNPYRQTCVHLGGHLATVSKSNGYYHWECRCLNSNEYKSSTITTKRTRWTLKLTSNMPTLEWNYWLESPNPSPNKPISILSSPQPVVNEHEGIKRQLENTIDNCNCQSLALKSNLCECNNLKNMCNCKQIERACCDTESTFQGCPTSTMYPANEQMESITTVTHQLSTTCLKNPMLEFDIHSLKMTLSYLMALTFSSCSSTTPSFITFTNSFVTSSNDIQHWRRIDLKALHMTLSYLLAVTSKSKQNDYGYTTIGPTWTKNPDKFDPHISKINFNALRQTLSYLIGMTCRNEPEHIMMTTFQSDLITPPRVDTLPFQLMSTTKTCFKKNILHFTLHLDDVTHLIAVKSGATIVPTIETTASKTYHKCYYLSTASEAVSLSWQSVKIAGTSVCHLSCNFCKNYNNFNYLERTSTPCYCEITTAKCNCANELNNIEPKKCACQIKTENNVCDCESKTCNCVVKCNKYGSLPQCACIARSRIENKPGSAKMFPCNLGKSWTLIRTAFSTTTTCSKICTSSQITLNSLSASSVTWPNWLLKQHITRKSYTNLPRTYAGLILPTAYLSDKYHSTFSCARDCWKSKTTHKYPPCNANLNATTETSKPCIIQREIGLKDRFVTLASSLKDWEKSQQSSTYVTVSTVSSVNENTINWLQLLITAGIFRIRTTTNVINKGQLQTSSTPKLEINSLNSFYISSTTTAMVSTGTKFFSTLTCSMSNQKTTTLSASLTTQTTSFIPTTLPTTQSTLPTSQCTLSTSQSTLSTSQSTLSTSQITLSTSQITLSTSQITLSTSQSTLSTSQSTLSTSQCTLSTSQSTLLISQSTLSTTQSILSTIQCIFSTSQSALSTTQSSLPTTQSSLSTTQSFLTTTQSTLTATQNTLSTAQITLIINQKTSPTNQLPFPTTQITSSTTQTQQKSPATISITMAAFLICNDIKSILPIIETTTIPIFEKLSCAPIVTAISITKSVTIACKLTKDAVVSMRTFSELAKCMSDTTNSDLVYFKNIQCPSTMLPHTSKRSNDFENSYVVTLTVLKLLFPLPHPAQFFPTALKPTVCGFTPGSISMVALTTKRFCRAKLTSKIEYYVTHIPQITTQKCCVTLAPVQMPMFFSYHGLSSVVICSKVATSSTDPSTCSTSYLFRLTSATSLKTQRRLTFVNIATMAVSSRIIMYSTAAITTSKTYTAIPVIMHPTSMIIRRLFTTTRLTSNTTCSSLTIPCLISTTMGPTSYITCLKSTTIWLTSARFTSTPTMYFSIASTCLKSSTITACFTFASYPITCPTSASYSITCLTSASNPIICLTSVSFLITCSPSVPFPISCPTSAYFPFPFPGNVKPICKTHQQMLPKFDWKMLMGGGKSSPPTWTFPIQNRSNPFVMYALWLLKRNNTRLKFNFEKPDKTKTSVSHGVSQTAYNDIKILTIGIIFIKTCV